MLHPDAVKRDQELKKAHSPELSRFPRRLLSEEDFNLDAIMSDIKELRKLEGKPALPENQLHNEAVSELEVRKQLYNNRRTEENSINAKYGDPKLTTVDLKNMGDSLKLDEKQLTELKADILAVLKHATQETTAAFDHKYKNVFGESIADSKANKMFARFSQFGLEKYKTTGEQSEFWKKDEKSSSQPSSPRKEEAAGAASNKPSESSGNGKKLSIYNKPTRESGDGFDEKAMFAQFQKLPAAMALSEQMAKQGFQYVGHTGSDSKANTDFKSKEIRINKGLSTEMAALSLAYELKNASQADEFKKTLSLLDRKDKTPELANAYAEGVLRKEAKSVLIRSQMAVSMNREDLIKNQRYNEIAKDSSLSDAQKEDAIFKEMKENGTVRQGKKKAFDHYVEQFWTHKPIMSKL